LFPQATYRRDNAADSFAETERERERLIDHTVDLAVQVRPITFGLQAVRAAVLGQYLYCKFGLRHALRSKQSEAVDRVLNAVQDLYADGGTGTCCTSKRTVLYMPSIVLRPHVDVVDGLEHSSNHEGNSETRHANSMLCGPLVVGGDDAHDSDCILLGAAQVLEARKRLSAGGGASDGDTSVEEHKFLQRLIQVFAYAG